MVQGRAARCATPTPGRSASAPGSVINKYKVAKHFDPQIADGSFSYQRKTEQINGEAALDGLYVLRTTCPRAAHHPASCASTSSSRWPSARTARSRTRRCAPDPSPPRRPRARALLPVPARLLPAVRAPSPARADAIHRRHTDRPDDPVAPARRPGREHQAAAPHPRRPACLQPRRPIAELGTVCRNQLRSATAHLSRLTNRNTVQAKALGLLDVTSPRAKAKPAATRIRANSGIRITTKN